MQSKSNHASSGPPNQGQWSYEIRDKVKGSLHGCRISVRMVRNGGGIKTDAFYWWWFECTEILWWDIRFHFPAISSLMFRHDNASPHSVAKICTCKVLACNSCLTTSHLLSTFEMLGINKYSTRFQFLPVSCNLAYQLA